MNDRQKAIVRMLQADRRRDLYEGSVASGKYGSGDYYVSYSANERYAPLRRVEVAQLVNKGIIKRKWPDVEMYVLAR